MSKITALKPAQFVVTHCLVWWVMIVLGKGDAAFHGDMAEVYAWSQHWLMGSDKHPQFLPWMAKFWFMVAPKTIASFYLLSAVNLAVGMLGILALGRALKFETPQIMVALALCALAFPYLTLADKLNMNTICLATWPWLAWAFVKTIDIKQQKRLLYAVAFGLLATCAMLSKYYSAFLLFPLFSATFLPSNRWVWRTNAPYVALVVFIVSIAPHLIWLDRHTGAVDYATDQRIGDGIASKANHLFQFFIVPLSYWPIPLVISGLWLVNGSPLTRAAKLFRWPKGKPELALMVIGPWFLTLVVGASGLAELGVPWAIPIGFAFTFYLVANADSELLAKNGPKLISAFRFIWPGMIIGGIVFFFTNGVLGGMGMTTQPYPESATAIIKTWEKNHDQPLRWISKGNDAGQISFFAPEPIEALPARPNQLPSYYPPLANWQKMNGVVFCSLKPVGKKPDQACIDQAMKWARDNDFNADAVTQIVQHKDVFGGHSAPHNLSVVYVSPKK